MGNNLYYSFTEFLKKQHLFLLQMNQLQNSIPFYNHRMQVRTQKFLKEGIFNKNL